MPLVKKSETLPPQPVVLLIFGEGGLSKTSLSNTAKNPVNIDTDRGVKRSYGKPDTIVIEQGWGEVLAELANGTFQPYDTIVCDTAKGAIDDFIGPYVQEQDYKLKTNALKRFGAMGDEFKRVINIFRNMGKDIIIIAHSKPEQEGDVIKRIPDVTGSSSQLLLRIADQVGYMSMRNGKRVISFNPSDGVVGKNVAGLPDIELPSHLSPEWKDFCDREIIQKTKDALSQMSEEQTAALSLIDDYRAKIDAVVPSHETLTALLAEIRGLETHISKQLIPYFTANNKKIGWKFDKEGTKTFIPMEAKKADTTKPTEQTPAAEETKETPAAEQPASEGNVDLFREQSKA